MTLQRGHNEGLKLGMAVEWDKGGRFERFFSTDSTWRLNGCGKERGKRVKGSSERKPT